MKPSGKGPVIEIGRNDRRERWLRIKLTYRLLPRSNVALKFDDQTVSKVYNPLTDISAIWSDDNATELVRLFMEKNSVIYSYRSKADRAVYGETSLMGFTDAWRFAVKFLRYNPLGEDH